MASLITPNLPELKRLSPQAVDLQAQVAQLMQTHEADILLKGGHATEAQVKNIWFQHGQWQTAQEWLWPRLPGEFHGSGCTLASAIAGQLAVGTGMPDVLHKAQSYTQQSLAHVYAIAAGQLIPARLPVQQISNPRKKS